MQEVMGGTFAQQIICRSVPHRSEKDEEFYQACNLPAWLHQVSMWGIDYCAPSACLHHL